MYIIYVVVAMDNMCDWLISFSVSYNYYRLK